MQTIDLETCIKDFLAFGRQLQSLQPLFAENVLSDFFAWYRENRITDASLIEDEDMLLLQWGVIRPLDILEPTDLRGIRDEEMRYSNSNYEYVNFTRQVFPSDGNKDVELDDVAIQMSITLCYGSTVEKEHSDNLWIGSPNDLEHGKGKFRSIPFVNLLLKTPVSRVEIIVQHCG
jgi:hypothetical protein